MPALGLVALVLALLAFPVSSPAATFVVTTTADTLDGTCDGHCSLREAVSAANAAAGDDAITVPAGTYLLTRTGAQESLNATGDLDVSGVTTIQGAGAAATVLDGYGADRVLDVSAGALTLRDTTITGGALRITGAPCSPSDHEGAGVAGVADVTLERVRVTRNRYSGTFCSASRGGGVSVRGGTAALTVTDSEISDNYASDGAGGIQFSGSSLVVRGSTIARNATDVGGGGIGADGPLTIVNSTVSGNRAAANGGIGLGGGATAQIASTTITANEATGSSGGGGIGRSFGSSAVTLRNTILAGNRAYAGPDDDCGDAANITYSSAGYDLVGPGCALIGGAGNLISADPGLSPLGGLGPVHEPLAASPARNAGDPAGCADLPAGGLSTDQRGLARALEGRCDIGAAEYAPPPSPAPPAPQTPAPPAARLALNTKAPQVRGTARAGRLVRCAAGTWSDAGARSVTWLANGRALKGARKRTLKLSPRLAGRALQCRETVRDAGRTVRADSAPVIVRKALKRR